MKPSILILLLTIFALSCSKAGKKGDYFRCKINGVDWSFGGKGGALFEHDLQCFWRDSSRLFYIDATRSSDQSQIHLTLYDSTAALKSGFFRLTSCDYRDYNKSYSYSYKTDSLNYGYINIKFDEGGKRVSGVFSFRAKFEASTEVVNVTEGEFNIPCEVRDN